MQALELVSNNAITLRNYQQGAVDDAMKHFYNNARGVMMVAPTGAGKTEIFSDLSDQWVKDHSKRILITAHRGELLTQTANKLAKRGLPFGKIKAGPSTNPQAPIQIASIQTLANRELPWEPDIIIVDEAHLAKARTYMNLFDRHPYAIRYLFTATPIRTDGRGFDDVADQMVVVTTVNDLLSHPDGPFLVRPRIKTGSDLNDLDEKVKITAGEYNKRDLETYMIELVGDVIEEYKTHAMGRKGIVFCSGVKHSQKTCAMFNEAGITAEHIDGTMKEDERSAVLTRLKLGHTRIVTNANVLCEGFDEGSISYIGLARATTSEALYLQMCGRGLRLDGPTWEASKANGKLDCVIIDHGNNEDKFGHVCDPKDWTLSGKKTKFKDKPTPKCSVCREVFPAHFKLCFGCGYERQAKEIEIVTINTILKEKEPENPVFVKYRQLLRFCKWSKTGPRDFSYANDVMLKEYGFEKLRQILPFTVQAKMQQMVKNESWRPANKR